MYLNLRNRVLKTHMELDKLEHEMYLNEEMQLQMDMSVIDKLEHEMYLNNNEKQISENKTAINWNMRCI